jgi:hypothetical protein
MRNNKKYGILFILFFLFGNSKIIACDICGCGAGNSYIGIIPDFAKRMAGLRYRYNAMLSHVGVDGTTTYLTTKENYQIVDVWGAIKLGTKFKLMFTLPVNFNERENQGIVRHKSGIGDASVFGYFKLLETENKLGKNLLEQTIWVGAGIKLPTGKYNPQDKSSVIDNANLFQLGTGSVDYNFALSYTAKINSVGLNVSGIYKLNTENRYHYKYGNKISLASQVFYKKTLNNSFTIAPNLGFQYEYSCRDTDKGLKAPVSGGNLSLGTVGFEITKGKVAMGANYQMPMAQDMALGIVKAKDRFMVHLGFAF